MKAADVRDWLASEVTESYFLYLRQRIESFKKSRGDGALLHDDPQKMYRANWELVGGLKELEALADIQSDPEQVYEVFGIEEQSDV